MGGLADWWNTRAAAADLHAQLRQTPEWTQWRVPCDVTDPGDARTARVVMVLLQRYPNHYKVLWGAKSLTIYHADGYKAVVSAAHRDMLAKWGLQLRPRRDSEGLPAPPAQAGGKQFDIPGERCDPPPGGAPVERTVTILDPNGRPIVQDEKV